MIEEEILGGSSVHLSNFKRILETEMLNNPEYWQKYYYPAWETLRLKRQYSLSDRVRYYLPNKKIEDAIIRLINNLDAKEIPLTLISQYSLFNIEELEIENYK